MNAIRVGRLRHSLAKKVDVFTPSLASTVTSGVFNDVNQLTGQNPWGGDVPVQFKGKVNEAATVTVGGQPAQVTPDQTSATGGRNFSATLNLSPGTHTIAVTAEDFGAGSGPHHGGNVATKNYEMTVAAGTARSFSYDANGNCTAKGGVTYEWDGEDRLVAVNRVPRRHEFTYDGFGRRVKMVEKFNGTITDTKQFIWDGTQIAEERDGANNVTKRFYSQGEQIAGSSYYYTRDHLGSVREMTDAAGNVRARYEYDPYGRRTKVAGDLEATFGFTGHYYQPWTKLHLALYRAYDADLGRWLNRDPIEEAGGINLYGYVHNNPINFVDPLGLDYYVIYVPGFSGLPHQVVIGDDGSGGSYEIDYGPASGGLNRIYGSGKYNYTPRTLLSPNQTAYDLSKARCVKTTPDVDKVLNDFAAGLGANNNTPNYCFLGNNCWSTAPLIDSIANSMMNPPPIIITVPPSFNTVVNTPVVNIRL